MNYETNITGNTNKFRGKILTITTNTYIIFGPANQDKKKKKQNQQKSKMPQYKMQNYKTMQ